MGHSITLRKAAGVASEYLPANGQQIHLMVSLAEKALSEDASGVSFGLDYAPGSSEEEILALAGAAVRYDRPVSIHTRLFTPKDLFSLAEAAMIARRTGARVLVSHFVYQYGAG